MKFGLPPWLKRAKEPEVTALANYKPVVDLTDAEESNGWTPESLAEYHAESHTRAMAAVAASMEGRLRPRPRWANNQYSPARWRG